MHRGGNGRLTRRERAVRSDAFTLPASGPPAAPHRTGSAPRGAWSCGWRDFNQDGRSDVAVTSTDTNSVSVLRGDGNGGFGVAESVATGTKPYYMASGDALGSGRTDLVVVTDPFSLTASSNLSLLTNVNQGMSFSSTPALFTSTMESRVFGPVAIGDLDRDGLSEIILTSLGRFTVMGGQPFASGAFTILSHTGGGNFSVSGPFLARMAYGDVSINDFDRNGRPDLAFVGSANDNTGDNVVDLHLVQLNGGIEEAPLYSGGPRSPLRPTVVSGDLNGDAWPDLILSNPGDSGAGTLGVLLNQGNATFPQAAPVTYPAGVGVLMLAAGDLNGDQRLDVVMTADGDARGKTPGSLHIYIQAARK